MNNFEFNGFGYRKSAGLQKNWGLKLINSIQFNGDEEVLDLGCGEGGITLELAKNIPYGNVIGIDASESMIEAAKQYEGQNCSFSVQEIDSLSYENKFDIIFSNATLHWVKNHKLLYENCHRALKPNGRIYFNFAGDGNCRNSISVAKELIGSKYKQHFKGFEWPWYLAKKTDYEELLAGCPFPNAQLKTQIEDKNFPHKQAFIAWLDQPVLVPFLSYLNDTKIKDDFRADMIGQMVIRCKQNDDTYFETFRRLIVFAQKKPGK